MGGANALITAACGAAQVKVGYGSLCAAMKYRRREWGCPAVKHQQVKQMNIISETSGVTLPPLTLSCGFVAWCIEAL